MLSRAGGLLADLCLRFSALTLATSAGNLLQEGVGEGKESGSYITRFSTSKHAKTSTSYPGLLSLRQRKGNKRKALGKRLQEG